jgi:hypothetical protein
MANRTISVLRLCELDPHSPSDTLRAFRDLPVMDTDRVEQQSGHETRHSTSDDPDLLILLACDERSFRFLGLEVGHPVEPSAVRVVDGGEGVTFAERCMLHVERGGLTDQACVGECVETAAGGSVFGGQPDETSSITLRRD